LSRKGGATNRGLEHLRKLNRDQPNTQKKNKVGGTNPEDPTLKLVWEKQAGSWRSKKLGGKNTIAQNPKM